MGHKMAACRAGRCGSFCVAVWHRLRDNVLLVLIFLGVVLGFVVGFAANKSVNEIKDDPEKKATIIMLIGFPGELFMNALKMLILPLIVASLITALATLDGKATGKIGRRTVLYYFGTMTLAVLLGMLLVTTIKPGVRSGRPDIASKDLSTTRTLDAFLDLLRNCFPNNIVAATFLSTRTKYISVPPIVIYHNRTLDGGSFSPNSNTQIFFNGTHNISVEREVVTKGSDTVPSGTETRGSMNVLGLVVFSIVFGIILGRSGQRGMALKAFFVSLNEAIMRMINLVMWATPIGVASLIAVKLVGMDDISEVFKMLGILIGTAVSGLLIHGFIFLPTIYFIFTRKNPLTFMKGMADAFVTAFGTDSSAATLPTTIRCVEENNGVDRRISRFVLPLGATVNMDGTALYEAVGTIWVAQLNGITLDPGQYIAIILTAIAAAVGAAAIPSAGLITMLIILQAINLPLADIGLLWAIDWFVDRFRTVVNVFGDAIGAGIIAHLSRDDLLLADIDDNEEGWDESHKGRYTCKDPDVHVSTV